MENSLLLDVGDYFFTIFHSLLIVFNLFAWIWKPLRKWHLWTISLTFASWGILGIWYGWGYCPLTDWHWDILQKKGIYNLPNSYISYLIARILKLQLPASMVDTLTLLLALAALILSIWVNFFKNKKA
ncbi:MAG: DUF2784 domain-containing protein [Cecembia sp.]